MPCVLGWSNSQMFEQTDDVQQCVKVSFEVSLLFETRDKFFQTQPNIRNIIKHQAGNLFDKKTVKLIIFIWIRSVG